MADSPFQDAPSNPFSDMDVTEDVDTDLSNERIGQLDIDDGTAAFVDEHGNRFRVRAELIDVSVTIDAGIAQVTSIIVGEPVAEVLEQEALQETAVEMIDAHMGELAKWLAENMPGEIDRMSPSETMVQMVIRLLGNTLPPVDGRGFVQDTKKAWADKQAQARKLK